MDDADTAVLTVAPSRAGALIGSGPTGAPLQPLSCSANFRAYNIDWENRAADYAISQALVTDISYANASFYGCRFKSYQDTWYTGRNASTYVVDSVIYGQTDCAYTPSTHGLRPLRRTHVLCQICSASEPRARFGLREQTAAAYAL